MIFFLMNAQHVKLNRFSQGPVNVDFSSVETGSFAHNTPHAWPPTVRHVDRAVQSSLSGLFLTGKKVGASSVYP